eukprot:308902-Chlamydomonas_euryale.AAC.3
MKEIARTWWLPLGALLAGAWERHRAPKPPSVASHAGWRGSPVSPFCSIFSRSVKAHMGRMVSSQATSSTFSHLQEKGEDKDIFGPPTAAAAG